MESGSRLSTVGGNVGPLFLIGAGFGVEARRIAGPIRGNSIYIGEYEIDCGYPLVGDLPHICYPDAVPIPPPSEVEACLAESISLGDWEPIERLCFELFKADFYIAPRLLRASAEPNPYFALIQDFPESSYISFNYDSFLEFGLFQAGRWSPHDGFGVSVAAEVGFSAEPFAIRPSTNFVLHPHGSLLIHTEEFDFGAPDASGMRWMQRHDPPRFQFDPHSLAALYSPLGRVLPGLGYNPRMASRVIAPVPGKAEGDRGHFVKAVHSKAVELLGSVGSLISLGYSFAELDADSYIPLLKALAAHPDPHLVVVSPDADSIAARLASVLGGAELLPLAMTFGAWVDAGYPGARGCDL